jgi:hypothetical protein
MPIVIKKGKVLKKSVIVVYDEGDNLQNTADTKKEYKNAIPHPDLVKALQDLRLHAAFLFKLISPSDIKVKSDKKGIQRPEFTDPSLADEFTCSGFSQSENGIILNGRVTTDRHKSGNFNTPLENLGEDKETAYSYKDDLAEKLDIVSNEFALLIGGKQGADPQGTMNFPEEDADSEENK